MEQLDSDYDVGLKHEGGPEVVRRYLAAFAYAEERRHTVGEPEEEDDTVLAALEAEAIAALKSRQAKS